MPRLLLAVCLTVAAAYLIKRQADLADPLQPYKTRAKKFSGLKPEVYYQFLNELEMYARGPTVETAQWGLHRALEALQELALYAHPASDAPETIRELVNELGDFCESRLFTWALKSDQDFTPKYLKEYTYVL
jgi:hypothetical protein